MKRIPHLPYRDLPKTKPHLSSEHKPRSNLNQTIAIDLQTLLQPKEQARVESNKPNKLKI